MYFVITSHNQAKTTFAYLETLQWLNSTLFSAETFQDNVENSRENREALETVFSTRRFDN